ncbi:hypothetical protein BGZ93_004315 [Podila epicladia]|nr:hypothetical protein BGZ93_004315 [Podila epicladia]
MVSPSAFDLPEIRNHIAEHLSKKELLACCRVSKDWHFSFFPHLWRTVNFNGAGPIFSNSHDPDPRVANIRCLIYNYSAFEGLMPTQGYSRLQELEILRESTINEQKLAQTGSKGGSTINRWHLPTALVHSLAHGPLSSVELTSIDRASTEFWEALSQCRTLKSFRLENVSFPIGAAGPAFWKICRSVEILSVILCEAVDCLLIHNRMLRLKHLVVDRSEVQGQLDEWNKSAKPWICSPNLESLKYSYSSTSNGEDEFHEMVLDIKAAIAAAARGINHYATPSSDQGTDDDDENMEQYRGLIPGRKLHSLETDNYGIRDEDLGFIVDNMDTLRTLCVSWVSIGALALEALGRHRHTIVELDLQCDGINSSHLVNTVMSCTQLQVLTLRNIPSAALLESEPWACLQLKRLALNFQRLGVDMDDPQGARIISESRAVWQRISRLMELEHVDMNPNGGWVPGFRPDFTLACGLGQLRALTKMRSIYIDLLKLALSDAEWMVRAWPKLEVIRGQNPRLDHARIDAEVVKIYDYIAEYLPREALLACCRVSKDWHSSFFPHLWRTVSFNGAGPIFSNSDDPDPRVANIRCLMYNYNTFEGPMPTHGYTRLTHLEICRERNHLKRNLTLNGSKGGCAVDLWHFLTALTRSLANGPLSSLKMTRVKRPPAAFWEAVVQCRQLKSFHLNGLYFPLDSALSLSKIYRWVESLNMTNSITNDCMPLYTRMFQLKHLAMDSTRLYGDHSDWEAELPWLCSPNLETLEYNNCVTSMRDDEFHAMVKDIKAAIAAAAEGRNHYEATADGSSNIGSGGVGKDMERYRGLVPGRKLHSLETDSFIEDEDLGFLVANMMVLRKLCVSGASIGTAAIAALDRHRHTIVELSLTCDSTNTAAVMSVVMGLMQLESYIELCRCQGLCAEWSLGKSQTEAIGHLFPKPEISLEYQVGCCESSGLATGIETDYA